MVREDQAVEPNRVVFCFAILGIRSERHRARVDPRLKGLIGEPEVLSRYVLRLTNNEMLTDGRPVVLASIGTRTLPDKLRQRSCRHVPLKGLRHHLAQTVPSDAERILSDEKDRIGVLRRLLELERQPIDKKTLVTRITIQAI